MVILITLLLMPGIAGAGYIDNDDGTVVDKVTNLMWQKCPYGNINNPGCTGLATVLRWSEAIDYCGTLSLGGFDDWRLPNIKELQSISVMTTYNAAIDQGIFPNTFNGGFWSSTTYAQLPQDAWIVTFDYGYTAHHLKTVLTNYVRCVRGE